MGRSGCTSLVHHPHDIVPNIQAGLAPSKGCMGWTTEPLCSSGPYCTESSSDTSLHENFHRRSTETLPVHITDLQRLREACRGLGVDITGPQFSGIIMLSMPTPSWDPVIGTLGGILDPNVVILHLSTEWSRRQGLISTGNNANVMFQTGFKTSLQCGNCNWMGHTKAIVRAKCSGQKGQYPDWFKGK